MSLLYPRTVAVYRSANNAVVNGNQVVGAAGYSGRESSPSPPDQEGEVSLFSGIPANINPRSAARNRQTIVPSDVSDLPEYQICLHPTQGPPIYSIRDRDIIVDDEGYRYIVRQNAYLLGYQLNCVREEV